MPALLPAGELEAWIERRRVLEEAGVEEVLAAQAASGEIPTAVLDSAEVAASCGRSLEVVASVYFAIGTLLNYGWIAERASCSNSSSRMGDGGFAFRVISNWKTLFFSLSLRTTKP